MRISQTVLLSIYEAACYQHLLSIQLVLFYQSDQNALVLRRILFFLQFLSMFATSNISNITIGQNDFSNSAERASYNSSDDSTSYEQQNNGERDAYEHVDMFEYIGEGWLLTIISALGCLGSILAINVLVKPSLKGTFTNILTGLAIFDALFLATLPFTFGLSIISPYYEVLLLPICFKCIYVMKISCTTIIRKQNN